MGKNNGRVKGGSSGITMEVFVCLASPYTQHKDCTKSSVFPFLFSLFLPDPAHILPDLSYLCIP